MNQLKLVRVITFYFPLSYFFNGLNDWFCFATRCKMFSMITQQTAQQSAAYHGAVIIFFLKKFAENLFLLKSYFYPDLVSYSIWHIYFSKRDSW